MEPLTTRRWTLAPLASLVGLCTSNAQAAGVFELPAQTRIFCPHHTRGDTEFKGHGPDVRATVVLQVANNGAVIGLGARGFWQETKSDWTTAQLDSSYVVAENMRLTQVWKPVGGVWQWVSIPPNSGPLGRPSAPGGFVVGFYDISYRDTDTSMELFYDPDWYIGALEVVGDTPGADVVSCGFGISEDASIVVNAYATYWWNE